MSLCSPRQHYTHLHLVQCDWRESGPSQGLL